MAQVDVQWPSEDEEFDAVSDGKPVVATIDEPDADEPKPSPSAATTSVKVISHDDSDEADDSEDETPEETEPSKPPEPVAESDKIPESSPEKPTTEPEPAPEPAAKPDPEPVPELPVGPLGPPAKPSVTTKTSKTPTIRLIAEAVLVLAVIALGLWSWTLSSDNSDLKQQVSKLNSNPQLAIQKQTQQLISQVGNLMTLPTGEAPTIANVSDATQAKKQSAFFNSAQNGDKVLMYVKAGQAILYRPSTNKIILVAPLTFTGSNTAAATPTSTTKTTTTPPPPATTKTTP